MQNIKTKKRAGANESAAKKCETHVAAGMNQLNIAKFEQRRAGTFMAEKGRG